MVGQWRGWRVEARLLLLSTDPHTTTIRLITRESPKINQSKAVQHTIILSHPPTAHLSLPQVAHQLAPLPKVTRQVEVEAVLLHIPLWQLGGQPAAGGGGVGGVGVGVGVLSCGKKGVEQQKRSSKQERTKIHNTETANSEQPDPSECTCHQH